MLLLTTVIQSSLNEKLFICPFAYYFHRLAYRLQKASTSWREKVKYFSRTKGKMFMKTRSLIRLSTEKN